MKISDKVHITKKALQVSTDSRTTLGPIGLAQLTMNKEEHSFRHYFIVCTKLKQPLIIGLDLGVNRDTSRTLYL